MPRNPNLVADVVAKAVEAAEDGQPDKADDLIRRAVHAGMRPIDIVTHALGAKARTVEAPTDSEEPNMRVVYDGPEPGVQLAPALGDIRLERGRPVDLPAEVARELLRQPHFRRPRRGETPERPSLTETPETTDPTVETR